MEFFDKLTKKATETYKGAAEKTGKLAKEAKLKIKINENKSKINDLYQEIGKKVYQKHASNEDVCVKKEIEEECAQIDILSTEIDEYHKQILSLSDIKVCENCKETISKNAKFCPKCGQEQPQVEEKEEEALEVEVVGEQTQEENETTKTTKEEEPQENISENTQAQQTAKATQPQKDAQEETIESTPNTETEETIEPEIIEE